MPRRAFQRGNRLTRRPVLLIFSALMVALLVPRQAPGTVAEQRARLPPPARCTDHIEGVWKAHQYIPTRGHWYVTELEVYRVDGDDQQLTGNMVVTMWEGDADDAEPPPCQGQLHYRLSMPSRGTAIDGDVEFFGTSWQMEEMYCGGYRFIGYNLDNFSGTIDPDIQEFQSVNNDGGMAVNVPTVFRRIECFERNDSERVDVTPPPYMPLTQSSGCNCNR